MPAVPLFLAGLPVVAWIRFPPLHGATGGAPEFSRGQRFVPAGLAICRASDGFYLFGCDAEWNTVTDTWHETLDDAQHQAEFEYEGIDDSWNRP